jgi:hypothetical protein
MTSTKPQAQHKVSTVEVVPGELSVHEHWHEIPYVQPVPCWTYITEGMAAHGQKELIITLRQEESMAQRGEAPDFVLRLIGSIFDLAKQGRPVDAGGYTSLTLADDRQKVGIPFHMLYLDPISLPGVTLPSPALTVRFMSHEEYKVYLTFGRMRLVASWAQHYRYVPCPPWSEMPAPKVVSLERFKASILNKSARMHAGWSTVNLEGQEIVLRLQAVAREVLPGQFPRADAGLAWIPEQNQTTMNVAPGSRLARVAGCFILFVPGQQAATARVFEDGFAVLLPTDTWVEVREAMLAGKPMTVPAADKQFRLEHV